MEACAKVVSGADLENELMVEVGAGRVGGKDEGRDS